MSISRKSVLITGCSAGGIGAGLAEEFHEKGYHVFATLRTPSKIPETLSKAAYVTVLTLDVLSASSISAAVDAVTKETGGKLDVLLNNSGSGISAPGLDTSIEAAKKIFDLNFFAPMVMMQAFAPLLIKARGCLVNNSSANCVVHMPFLSAYNASKAALTTAGETWRLELQTLGVRTITLVTMGVNSTSDSKPDHVEIPETSYYFPIRSLIYGVFDGHLKTDGITTKEFATQVVRAVEKKSSGMVWVGGNASLVSWAWFLSPQFVKDMIVQKFIPVGAEMARVSQRRNA
ncbi:short-chain dehydrogenase/reductase [Rhexocercosporidium sp. MPI-PUGE-AT-0058]|nr:short-chain dehydrogenase/reductase [Rhexocercosporidium sp. MPI-PUGE-AT-0058]